MVPRDRIELPSAPCKDAALPLDERGFKSVKEIWGVTPRPLDAA